MTEEDNNLCAVSKMLLVGVGHTIKSLVNNFF